MPRSKTHPPLPALSSNRFYFSPVALLLPVKPLQPLKPGPAAGKGIPLTDSLSSTRTASSALAEPLALPLDHGTCNNNSNISNVAIATTLFSSTTSGSVIVDNGSPRNLPQPPPKPKRISQPPQPKAKPLNLKSVPILPKSDLPAQSSSSTQSSASPSSTATASPAFVQISSTSTSTLTSTSKIPTQPQPQEKLRPIAAASVTQKASPTPPLPPLRKPRSGEDGGEAGAPSWTAESPLISGHLSNLGALSSPLSKSLPENKFLRPAPTPPTSLTKNTTESSESSAHAPTLPEGANPTLFNARSRLRSTSDAKGPPSLSVILPSQAPSRTETVVPAWIGSSAAAVTSVNIGHSGSPLSPTSPASPFGYETSDNDDWSDSSQPSANATSGAPLTTPLQKIQALAQEQTDRVRQINYAEKKADLADVVYEKSSHWRARGAEWGVMAKKAWEDRGGMGGIAGGIADRWKRREGNGIASDLTKPGGVSQIFGLPLEEAARLSRISLSLGIPAVVTRCIEYLDIMGVEEVGLYRVPGSTSNVARLKAMFDQGIDYDFLQKGNTPQSPHDVATLLKLYLRELPCPVIPPEIMPAYNIDLTNLESNLQQLREALRQLPLVNYVLLGALCQHLSNFADYESTTKMSISNLGLIFCPTLQMGSILFRSLLGGDGPEKERRRRLLTIWEDLDRRHEELENIEMIREFEMLERKSERSLGPIVRCEDMQERTMPLSTFADSSTGHDPFSSWQQPGLNGGGDLLNLGTSPPSESGGRMRLHSRVGPGSRVEIGSSPSLPSPPSPDRNDGGNDYNNGSKWSGVNMNVPKKPSEPPVMDLYDELMTRELNEATNTPLIDFIDSSPSGNDHNTSAAATADPSDVRWRRHAREPATNRSVLL
ncbi:hypothetical protein BGW38_001957 [Lunasporangiospora selenospora]|uniref:Rho-GAP domain-containing protein n=1 Tax=Lunasporangiospora selenospora TaxID=979761 RepID=A0A9P6FUV7_9FUNG|nr:hypothetical protein BGW38_001957 [Lunasporangiospora selenospora]